MCPTEPLLQGKVPFSKQAVWEQDGALHLQTVLSPLSSRVAKDSRVAAAWQGHAICDGTVSPGKGEAAEHYRQLFTGENCFGS